MAEKLLAWEIAPDGRPVPAHEVMPQLEAHLEDWIEKDLSLVDPGLMLLGRQVSTAFGTTLDLLGIDAAGDLAIIELKRQRSPRDMVAQALEYTAWASKLDYEDIVNLGARLYGNESAFRQRFEQRFSVSFPEALNSGQRTYLVAPELSASVVEVVAYLTERSVPINAVTFALYEVEDRRLLVRAAVVEEEFEPATTSKRRNRRTLDELLSLADARGTRPAVDELLRLRTIFPAADTSMSSIALKGRTSAGNYIAGLSIHPALDGEDGVVVNLSHANLEVLGGLGAEEALDLFNRIVACGHPPAKPFQWEGWSQVVLVARDEAQRLVELYMAAFGAKRA